MEVKDSRNRDHHEPHSEFPAVETSTQESKYSRLWRRWFGSWLATLKGVGLILRKQTCSRLSDSSRNEKAPESRHKKIGYNAIESPAPKLEMLGLHIRIFLGCRPL